MQQKIYFVELGLVKIWILRDLLNILEITQLWSTNIINSNMVINSQK